MKKEFHVISHTHWDREWYQPFEEFRLRLVDLIDNLLEIYAREPDYVFHLDAQTICLEDYLEIRPQHYERIKKLIKEKRLLVGPWYVHNDFYLTSGEATIRNLLIGTEIAESFGHCSMTGYTPDQFGLIGQLPQIFKDFGIHNCIFGRGYNLFKVDGKGGRLPVLTPNEFDWKSPDGSSVFTVLMRHWYNNAQRFSEDPAKSQRFLQLIDEALEATSTTSFRLLMNGVDHLEAQENLLPILEKLNDHLDDAEIYQSSMDEFLDRVSRYLEDKKRLVVHGELREGTNANILQGTLSSRPYLKTANARAQALLELQLEPLWSILGMLTDEQVAYPQDELRYVWKMLLKNHPHDSICGCSRDEVHRDNEHRFKRVFETGNDLLRRGLAQLTSRIDRALLDGAPYFVSVINTLPFERSEVVTARLFIPLEDEVTNVELQDERGCTIDFEVLESRVRNQTTITPINLPGQIACREVVIRFHCDKLPACGYRVYALHPAPGQLRPQALPNAPRKVKLENDYLELTVNSKGQVGLLDKVRGTVAKDVLQFVDEADVGHSYNFVAAKEDQPVLISDVVPTITLLEKSSINQSVELVWKPKLPEEYDFKRMRRSRRLVTNTIRMTLSLCRGSRRMDMKVAVENRSKDHRLRLLVNTDLASDISSSSAPFEFVQRDRRNILKGINDDGTQPNSGLVLVSDKDRSMAVFNEGIYEYEHLLNRRGSLAFTLVRSTGVINHDGFEDLSSDAEMSPHWCCPENQCLRGLDFRLAILPGVRKLAELERMRLAFMASPLTHFDAADPHKFSGGRVCVQDSEVKEVFYRDLPVAEVSLPRKESVLHLKGGLAFSALKKAERKSSYLLRIWNPANRVAKLDIKTKGKKELRLTNLSEAEGLVGHDVSQMSVGKARVSSLLIQ